MKKIFCFFLLATAFGCKKDSSGSGSGKMLLAREFREGLLETEILFSTEGKIIRLNNFITGGGTSTLGNYYLYEYNADGSIGEELHFSKDHNPTTRQVYTYNAQGKVSRIDEATVFTGDDDLDNFDYFEVYEYDNKNQVTQVTRRQSNSVLHSRNNYGYDDKGNLISFNGYLQEGGSLVLKQKLEIEPGTRQMPEHWKKLLLVPTDFNWYELYINKKTFTSYYGNPAGLVSVWTYPKRNNNNQGYVITAVNHFESLGSVNDIEFTYEYVQQ
jgi:hypothetical protein